MPVCRGSVAMVRRERDGIHAVVHSLRIAQNRLLGSSWASVVLDIYAHRSGSAHATVACSDLWGNLAGLGFRWVTSGVAPRPKARYFPRLIHRD